jgi:hypothetical protein
LYQLLSSIVSSGIAMSELTELLGKFQKNQSKISACNSPPHAMQTHLIIFRLAKPFPSSGKLSVSSMLSDEPSLSVEHAPDGGLNGYELTGGLLLYRLYIECGRIVVADGIDRGGGIEVLTLGCCCGGCWWW